ncbi:MAG: hypothetical protein IJK26_02880 [Clostridia bacterium]|nr:hypothetical protein [Clostridia bacterium]
MKGFIEVLVKRIIAIPPETYIKEVNDKMLISVSDIKRVSGRFIQCQDLIFETIETYEEIKKKIEEAQE